MNTATGRVSGVTGSSALLRAKANHTRLPVTSARQISATARRMPRGLRSDPAMTCQTLTATCAARWVTAPKRSGDPLPFSPRGTGNPFIDRAGGPRLLSGHRVLFAATSQWVDKLAGARIGGSSAAVAVDLSAGGTGSRERLMTAVRLTAAQRRLVRTLAGREGRRLIRSCQRRVSRRRLGRSPPLSTPFP